MLSRLPIKCLEKNAPFSRICYNTQERFDRYIQKQTMQQLHPQVQIPCN